MKKVAVYFILLFGIFYQIARHSNLIAMEVDDTKKSEKLMDAVESLGSQLRSVQQSVEELRSAQGSQRARERLQFKSSQKYPSKIIGYADRFEPYAPTSYTVEKAMSIAGGAVGTLVGGGVPGAAAGSYVLEKGTKYLKKRLKERDRLSVEAENRLKRKRIQYLEYVRERHKGEVRDEESLFETEDKEKAFHNFVIEVNSISELDEIARKFNDIKYNMETKSFESPDMGFFKYQWKNENKEGVLHILVRKHHKAYMNFLKIIKNVLKFGADMNVQNKDGQTPLWLAIRLEKYDLVENLLGNKDTPVTVYDINLVGFKPLAVRRNLVQRFLSWISRKKIKTDMRALTLLDLIDEHLKDVIDQEEKITNSAKKLLKAGKRNRNMEEKLVDYRMKKIKLQRIKTICENLGGIRNTANLTPLHQAAEKDDIDKVRMFLELGHDQNARAADNKLPLHMAKSELVKGYLLPRLDPKVKGDPSIWPQSIKQVRELSKPSQVAFPKNPTITIPGSDISSQLIVPATPADQRKHLQPRVTMEED